jgi:hypothetical protein
LFTLVKNKKIQDMLSNFWQDGRQSTLEFMVAEKGGVLVSNEDRLKVFEIKTSKTNHQGKPIYHLIYLTPSFYSYEDQHLFNNQKGSYYFLNATSRKSTCLVSTEESFFRHDFSKPIGNTDDLKFKLKINIPINMFRFEVVKN